MNVNPLLVLAYKLGRSIFRYCEDSSLSHKLRNCSDYWCPKKCDWYVVIGASVCLYRAVDVFYDVDGNYCYKCGHRPCKRGHYQQLLWSDSVDYHVYRDDGSKYENLLVVVENVPDNANVEESRVYHFRLIQDDDIPDPLKRIVCGVEKYLAVSSLIDIAELPIDVVNIIIRFWVKIAKRA